MKRTPGRLGDAFDTTPERPYKIKYFRPKLFSRGYAEREWFFETEDDAMRNAEFLSLRKRGVVTVHRWSNRVVNWYLLGSFDLGLWMARDGSR